MNQSLTGLSFTAHTEIKPTTACFTVFENYPGHRGSVTQSCESSGPAVGVCVSVCDWCALPSA